MFCFMDFLKDFEYSINTESFHIVNQLSFGESIALMIFNSEKRQTNDKQIMLTLISTGGILLIYVTV